MRVKCTPKSDFGVYFMRGVIVVVHQLSDIYYRGQICLKYVISINELKKILTKNEEEKNRI